MFSDGYGGGAGGGSAGEWGAEWWMRGCGGGDVDEVVVVIEDCVYVVVMERE